MRLRVAFMGTPDFAVPTLAAIRGQGHEVVKRYLLSEGFPCLDEFAPKLVLYLGMLR